LSPRLRKRFVLSVQECPKAGEVRLKSLRLAFSGYQRSETGDGGGEKSVDGGGELCSGEEEGSKVLSLQGVEVVVRDDCNEGKVGLDVLLLLDLRLLLDGLDLGLPVDVGFDLLLLQLGLDVGRLLLDPFGGRSDGWWRRRRRSYGRLRSGSF